MTNSATIDVSFVVIGRNEGEYIGRCIDAIRDAELEGIAAEILYVDGGSDDDSVEWARRAGADRIFEADGPRRAAENRNIGGREAVGEFVQFVDGDMALHPAWPRAALAQLRDRPDVAIVCGALHERNPGLWHRALELDWSSAPGEVDACGGGCMMRREVFEQVGGFPQDVRYGEEPLLCWRVRNELHRKIVHMNRTMAYHDLDLRGIGDYWRQYVRNGRSYAEIATRCAGTADPLWSRERTKNYVWAMTIAICLFVLLVAPTPIRFVVILFLGMVLIRKTVQVLVRGYPLSLAAAYALHTYFCTVPLAIGQLRYMMEKSPEPNKDT